MMKAGPGDSVVLHAPGGTEELEILDVRYEAQVPEPEAAWRTEGPKVLPAHLKP